MHVTVYSTTTCPYCTMVKNYLKSKSIAFTEYDVGRDPARGDEMVRKTGQMGVPVVEIGGTLILGFNRPEIDRALAAHSA